MWVSGNCPHTNRTVRREKSLASSRMRRSTLAHFSYTFCSDLVSLSPRRRRVEFTNRRTKEGGRSRLSSHCNSLPTAWTTICSASPPCTCFWIMSVSSCAGEVVVDSRDTCGKRDSPVRISASCSFIDLVSFGTVSLVI